MSVRENVYLPPFSANDTIPKCKSQLIKGKGRSAKNKGSITSSIQPTEVKSGRGTIQSSMLHISQSSIKFAESLYLFRVCLASQHGIQ